MDKQHSLLKEARLGFHARLFEEVLKVDQDGCPTNADKSSRISVLIAQEIATRIGATTSGIRLAGQTLGNQFESLVTQFLVETFPKLSHLRPGRYFIQHVGGRDRLAIGKFQQYAHLVDLYNIAKDNVELQAALGNAYTITPDLVIARELITEEELNNPILIADTDIARLADLREINVGSPILHASISCKWTIRSDRGQNSRTEALSFIRNRKGRLPHIVVVTGEPMPSRLSSIALGTGDIDCVYHFALPELIEAVNLYGNEDTINSLDIMIRGKRLKDIADLPLDLCV